MEYTAPAIDHRSIMRLTWLMSIFTVATLNGQLIEGNGGIVGKAMQLAETLEFSKHRKIETVQSGAAGHLQMPRPSIGDEIYVSASDAVTITLGLSNGRTITQEVASNGIEWFVISPANAPRTCRSRYNWLIRFYAPRIPYSIDAVTLKGTNKPTKVCTTYLSAIGGTEGKDYLVVGNSVNLDRKFYQDGDVVTIAVPVLDDGAPVHGANVEALVRYVTNQFAKEEAARIRLTDSKGDGNYSGVFRPPRASGYDVNVSISGREEHEAARFEVYPLLARLNSVELTEQGRHLALGLEILAAGRYSITTTIDAGNGRKFDCLRATQLDQGPQVVTCDVPFPLMPFLPPPYGPRLVHMLRSEGYRDDLVGTWTLKDGKWQGI
jgi:hypothetical protein